MEIKVRRIEVLDKVDKDENILFESYADFLNFYEDSIANLKEISISSIKFENETCKIIGYFNKHISDYKYKKLPKEDLEDIVKIIEEKAKKNNISVDKIIKRIVYIGIEDYEKEAFLSESYYRMQTSRYWCYRIC